ncbi:30S ribosomal protein S14 [Rhodoferax sp. 4810]|uniref:Small ribosomal subunit protein uS14 n=1 Tax=Thiospirillum jenense TaxID=1653858 RepID=A0A839H5P6_9GAMM|nr:30S ribosomal protein S14 [Thiospirillum jenense]MBB1073013.1 30S ribosomal protein S14 [Rhodoferax jenense]MBB1124961.1 30S ribosomal protein S14 [Thiospirillum jenense]
MAKKSMIARDIKRTQISQKFAKKRTALKLVLNNRQSTPEQIDVALLALQKLPRDANPIRQQRRCRITGRPHAVYRKFGLGRNKLREAVMRGDVPGVVKASW